MSSAEALFNSMNIEEPHIVIGRDRIIIVPEQLKRIAVQFDNNVETVTFDCPRYWDENDLSKMTIYINYIRPDGAPGSYKATEVYVDETNSNIIHFKWTITRNASMTNGPLAMLVCAKTVDTDGNEQNHWNSELCRDLYVSEGLDCVESIVDQHPDVITQILTKIDSFTVDNMLSKSCVKQEMDTSDEYEEYDVPSMNCLVNILTVISETFAAKDMLEETIGDIENGYY